MLVFLKLGGGVIGCERFSGLGVRFFPDDKLYAGTNNPVESNVWHEFDSSSNCLLNNFPEKLLTSFGRALSCRSMLGGVCTFFS